MPDTPVYDIFIAYSPAEEDWVHAHLKPDLESAGLTVATQEEFTPGRPKVDNWERTLAASRRLLLVITPAWLADNWQNFAGQLAHELDVAGADGRVIPLLLQPTPELPARLRRLEPVDFSDPARRDREWKRLLKALGVADGIAPGDLPTDSLPPHASLPAGSRMPYGRNPLFTGRERELLALAGALAAGSTAAIGQIAAATGLGGIGKSQLAVEFVHRYARFFAGGVFWLSFADPASVLGEVAACGDFPDLPLPEQAALVQRRWQEATPRLLVFDNCEAEELLDRWRPATGGCRVLLTSRRSSWDPVLGVQALALGVLPRSESVAFLCKFRPELPTDDPDLHALAEELGDLPLALHLAGSYLHRYRHSVTSAAYREELRRVDILNHPSLQSGGISPTGHEQHVARTFALSVERLNPDDPTDALALALLRRAACFAPGEPIPRALLLKTLEVPDSDSAEDAASPISNLQSPIPDALPRLTDLGLLEEAADGAMQMHRLLVVFVGQEDKTAKRVQRIAMLEADRLVNRGNMRVLHLWIGHLRHIIDRTERLAPHDPNTAENLNWLGYLLQARGDYADARPYFERALTIWEDVFGPRSPKTALGLNNLGYLLRELEDFEGARPYFERALAIREEVLAPRHPDVSYSLNNLGALLDSMGNSTGAQPYYEHALAIREEVLGPRHPATAQTLNNLGVLLLEQGNYVDAHIYLERALAIREEMLGPSHPDTARSLRQMGRLLQTQGDLAGARSYYERALAICEEMLDPHHPDTTNSLKNLGALLQAQGDLAGARPYYERALAIREEALGPRHPDTAQSLNNLGALLDSMGDWAGARPYYERALAIREEALGPRHPHTATSLNNLGALLQAQGDWAGARPYYERALAILEERLGAEHPNTRVVRGNLAGLLAEMGTPPAFTPT